MPKGEKEINIHIMHSMKGGCGKSTCALFKVLQIAYEQGIGDGGAHVLFMDADFKGSAMMKILFHRGNTSAEELAAIAGEEKARSQRELSTDAVQGSGIQHRMAIPDNFESYISLSHYLRDDSHLSVGDVICHSSSYQTEGKMSSGGAEEDESAADSAQRNFVNGYVDFILSSPLSESKDWFRHKQGKIAA